MELVPEGNYVLRISSAADSTVEHGSIQGNPSGTFTRLRVLQSYLDAEQPLNLSGIVVSLFIKVDGGRCEAGKFRACPVDPGMPRRSMRSGIRREIGGCKTEDKRDSSRTQSWVSPIAQRSVRQSPRVIYCYGVTAFLNWLIP
jgi:hypothetical protein